MKDDFIENTLTEFDKVTKNPEAFLSSQDASTNHIRKLLKDIYDFTKNGETKQKHTSALPELIIENFDLEQIWQQLELQNDELFVRALTNVSKFVVGKDNLLFSELSEANLDDAEGKDDAEGQDDAEGPSSPDKESSDEESESADDEPDRDDAKEDDELSMSGGESGDGDGKERVRRSKPSIVDDQFFKLDEMEIFLNAEEKKLNSENKEVDSGNESESDGEESVDLFEGGSGESDDGDEENARLKNPRYKDFFSDQTDEPRKTKRNKFLEEQDVDDEGDAERVQKSTLELREERLKNKINHIEQSAVSEKPWQLKGEITAENRPQNSLLEEIVEFDLTARPAPVITEQTTFQLEDIIRQRIKDRVFDSVQRKAKPVDTPLEYKKKLVLDQEKSKESLAQIYEKEYLQQKEALDPNAAEKEEEEPELHKQIRTMMHGLFAKLDALSNFHFTPRLAAPELKIVSNLPAISMEEVAPVAASDAALLAPEEVMPKTKGDLIGKTERSTTDKKRERRKKKLKQREHAIQKTKQDKLVNKINPGLGNKYSKEKAKKLLAEVTKDRNVDKMDESYGSKSVKSSTAFFTQLQDEVKAHIKNNTKRKSASKNRNFDAKKMKL